MIGNIFLIFVNLYFWRKYVDKMYFFIALIGIPSLYISILSILGKTLLTYSILSFVTFHLSVSLYDWKKFKEQEYFWFSLLDVGLITIIVLGLAFF